MQQTTNFKLNLPEGSDLFAPMNDYNPNWSAIDNQMQLNRLNSMQEADCIFAGGTFQLTRKVNGSTFFRFTAPADYTAGNTFTVDGEVFTAGLAGNFAALPDGAFTNGNIVVAYLDAGDAKKMALMTGSSPLPKNIDANTLAGHGADYFATAEALAAVNQTATSAGNAANEAQQAVAGKAVKYVQAWFNDNLFSDWNSKQITFKNIPRNANIVGIVFAFVPDTKSGGTILNSSSSHFFYPNPFAVHAFYAFKPSDSAPYTAVYGFRDITSITSSGCNIGAATLFGWERSSAQLRSINDWASYMIPAAVHVWYQEA